MTAITFDAIRKLGRAVAYYPDLAKPLGGATSVVLFSQLLYWHERRKANWERIRPSKKSKQKPG